jgi:hypothetical protein
MGRTEKREVKTMTGKRFQAMIDTDMQSVGLFDDLKDKHYFSFDEVVDLLNELSEDNQQYKILVKSLKEENHKLKLRLKDLGVEYF